jgi:hypothetical protein
MLVSAQIILFGGAFRRAATVMILGENEVAAERPPGQHRHLPNDSSGVSRRQT